MSSITNWYDIHITFDVENGNPNGDPNSNNEPRRDDETGCGLMSDVCLKRKIRNAVNCIKNNATGYKIFTTTWNVLNNGFDDARTQNKDSWIKYICENYFDIRAFGAVMSTGDGKGTKDGAVRGPVQVSMAKSIDPINVMELSITRDSVTNEKEKEKGRTMGTKFIIPYGLYTAKITVNPFEADRKNTGVTGFSDEDLGVFTESLQKMFELDRSAARGVMTMRKIAIFKHAALLGNYPTHKLMNMISISKKDGVEYPRSFKDYNYSIDDLAFNIKDVQLTVLD